MERDGVGVELELELAKYMSSKSWALHKLAENATPTPKLDALWSTASGRLQVGMRRLPPMCNEVEINEFPVTRVEFVLMFNETAP